MGRNFGRRVDEHQKHQTRRRPLGLRAVGEENQNQLAPVIAPSAPLEIILSGNAARFLHVRPARAQVQPPPGHFLTQWRVDPADDGDGGRWFMVTNLVTLFTFLLPRQPSSRFDSLVRDFRLRLSFALLAASPPLEWTPSEVVPVSGNPRAVVGSMNNMAQLLAWPRQPGALTPYEDFEAMLQGTPFSAVGKKGRYGIPHQAWLEHLNDLTRSLQSGGRPSTFPES